MPNMRAFKANDSENKQNVLRQTEAAVAARHNKIQPTDDPTFVSVTYLKKKDSRQ
jgi:hypothetical protein